MGRRTERSKDLVLTNLPTCPVLPVDALNEVPTEEINQHKRPCQLKDEHGDAKRCILPAPKIAVTKDLTICTMDDCADIQVVAHAYAAPENTSNDEKDITRDSEGCSGKHTNCPPLSPRIDVQCRPKPQQANRSYQYRVIPRTRQKAGP